MGAGFDRIYVPYGPFVGTGLTFAQLQSTASYKSGDLQGIGLKTMT